MRASLPLILLANSPPGGILRIPEGREAIYHWAPAVFLSLAILTFGLWLIRYRSVQTASARVCLWVCAGCLAVSYTAWDIRVHQGWLIFGPTCWEVGFPVLAVLALGTWLALRLLLRLGSTRLPVEMLAACFTVATFFWWFGVLVDDPNWELRNSAWSAFAMPWLWTGAFGVIVWNGMRKRLSPASRRFQTTCLFSAGGLALLWLAVTRPGLWIGVFGAIVWYRTRKRLWLMWRQR